MNRFWRAMLVMALVGLFASTTVVSADSVNVLKNGSFEDEFVHGVGKYWSAFSNGGLASYTYHDDTWDKVVYDGEHSQLLEMHTKAVGGSDKDRYMGIYQVVDVVPGRKYMFSFYGMVRSTEGSEERSRWNYRVQFGYDYDGGTDPWAVTNWVQMDWPESYRLSPGAIQGYAHGVTPNSDKLTLFIRVWKKFPTVGEEANINIDAVSLLGPAPAASIAAAPIAAVVEDEEEKPIIPKTGAGTILPFIGLGLAAVAIGLTTTRVLGKGR